jgi:hypothetical protein
MNITSKWLAIVAVAFVAGSFLASPELRAFAANTVGSSDIINETILSEDIKNSQVKASDIATDAVGASELQGVTKLLFGQCILTSGEAETSILANGGFLVIDCGINGVDSDDTAIATINDSNGCLHTSAVIPSTNNVELQIFNDCPFNVAPGTAQIAIIVFDK